MQGKLITVVETNAYLADAKGVLSEEEKVRIVDMIAAHPTCGDLIQGGAGIRKVRFGRGSRGKSGGVRIIYYYYDDLHPVYLLTLFAKNEQSTLGAAELKSLAEGVKQLKKSWSNKHG